MFNLIELIINFIYALMIAVIAGAPMGLPFEYSTPSSWNSVVLVASSTAICLIPHRISTIWRIHHPNSPLRSTGLYAVPVEIDFGIPSMTLVDPAVSKCCVPFYYALFIFAFVVILGNYIAYGRPSVTTDNEDDYGYCQSTMTDYSSYFSSCLSKMWVRVDRDPCYAVPALFDGQGPHTSATLSGHVTFPIASYSRSLAYIRQIWRICYPTLSCALSILLTILPFIVEIHAPNIGGVDDAVLHEQPNDATSVCSCDDLTLTDLKEMGRRAFEYLYLIGEGAWALLLPYLLWVVFGLFLILVWTLEHVVEFLNSPPVAITEFFDSLRETTNTAEREHISCVDAMSALEDSVATYFDALDEIFDRVLSSVENDTSDNDFNGESFTTMPESIEVQSAEKILRIHEEEEESLDEAVDRIMAEVSAQVAAGLINIVTLDGSDKVVTVDDLPLSPSSSGLLAGVKKKKLRFGDFSILGKRSVTAKRWCVRKSADAQEKRILHPPRRVHPTQRTHTDEKRLFIRPDSVRRFFSGAWRYTGLQER